MIYGHCRLMRKCCLSSNQSWRGAASDQDSKATFLAQRLPHRAFAQGCAYAARGQESVMATPLTSAAEARGIFLASLRELFLKFDSFVEMLLAQGCPGPKG
jgi:hypothetical protein